MKSDVESEKKELMQWSKLFDPATWTRDFPATLITQDEMDNRAPLGWKSSSTGLDLDLTRAIEDLVTGQAPSEWLQLKLTEMGLTRQAVTDAIRLFRGSEKTIPNWRRAKTVYNIFLTRYKGLYGYFTQHASAPMPSKRKSTGVSGKK